MSSTIFLHHILSHARFSAGILQYALLPEYFTVLALSCAAESFGICLLGSSPYHPAPPFCSGVFAQSQGNNPGTPSCLPHLLTSVSAVSFSSDSWISAQGPDMPSPSPAREHLGLEFHLPMPTPFSSSEKHPFGRERRTFRHKGQKEGQASPRERKRSPAGSCFCFSNSRAPGSFFSKGPVLGLAGKPPCSQLNFDRVASFSESVPGLRSGLSSLIRVMAGGLTEARPVMYPVPSPAGLRPKPLYFLKNWFWQSGILKSN